MEFKYQLFAAFLCVGCLHFILEANNIQYYTQSGIYSGKLEQNFDNIRSILYPPENNTLVKTIADIFNGPTSNNLSNITMSETNSCRPFTDIQQFSVILDGEIYPKKLSLFKNSTINFECLNSDTSKKIILFWNPFFGDMFYSLGNGNGLKYGGCPVTNCELTHDKSMLQNANLVITHMRDSITEPKKEIRPIFQRWVFLLYESPMHTADFSNYNSFYNLTSTYKVDSDFAHFYDNHELEWKKNPQFDKNYNFYSQKKNFAAAVISNCGSKSRMKYINEISSHISIDVFGNCGKPCPKTYSNGTESSDCKQIIGNDYKFYFSFENSICEDYITEKFHYILNYNIIPVVRGGGNYQYYVS